MRKKLGEILVESGAVAASDIAGALSAQAAGEPARLGDLLVSLGKITPTQLGQALAVQHGLPFVELPMIPPEIFQSIPLAFQQQHRVVPFAMVGDELSLAVADPSGSVALGPMLKRKVKVHVAAGDEIDAIHAVAGDVSVQAPPPHAEPIEQVRPTLSGLFGPEEGAAPKAEPPKAATSAGEELFSDLEGLPPAPPPAPDPPPPPPPPAPALPKLPPTRPAASEVDALFADLNEPAPVGLGPSPPPMAPRSSPPKSDLFTMLADPPPQPLGEAWESKSKPAPGVEPKSPSDLWDLSVDVKSAESIAREAAPSQSAVLEFEALPEPGAAVATTSSRPPIPALRVASPSGMFELQDVPLIPVAPAAFESVIIPPSPAPPPVSPAAKSSRSSVPGQSASPAPAALGATDSRAARSPAPVRAPSPAAVPPPPPRSPVPASAAPPPPPPRSPVPASAPPPPRSPSPVPWVETGEEPAAAVPTFSVSPLPELSPPSSPSSQAAPPAPAPPPKPAPAAPPAPALSPLPMPALSPVPAPLPRTRSSIMEPRKTGSQIVKPEVAGTTSKVQPELDLPDWLEEEEARVREQKSGQWALEAAGRPVLWTGLLDDVAPSKLIVAVARALVDRGVLTEAELLELLNKK